MLKEKYCQSIFSPPVEIAPRNLVLRLVWYFNFFFTKHSYYVLDIVLRTSDFKKKKKNFEESLYCFPYQLHNIAFSPTVYKDPNCSTSSPVSLSLFNNSHLYSVKRYLFILICASHMVSMFSIFSILLAICMSSLEKYLFKSSLIYPILPSIFFPRKTDMPYDNIGLLFLDYGCGGRDEGRAFCFYHWNSQIKYPARCKRYLETQ